MMGKMGKYIAFFVSALFLYGCNNPPEYKYQSAADLKAIHKAAAAIPASHASNPQPAAEAPAPSEVQAEPAAPVQARPSIPEFSVADMIRSGKAHDGAKVRVNGKMGKVLRHYQMSFLSGPSNDQFIEFSYGNMSEPDRASLSNIRMGQDVTVAGTWDASKKLLAGEEIMSK